MRTRRGPPPGSHAFSHSPPPNDKSKTTTRAGKKILFPSFFMETFFLFSSQSSPTSFRPHELFTVMASSSPWAFSSSRTFRLHVDFSSASAFRGHGLFSGHRLFVVIGFSWSWTFYALLRCADISIWLKSLILLVFYSFILLFCVCRLLFGVMDLSLSSAF